MNTAYWLFFVRLKFRVRFMRKRLLEFMEWVNMFYQISINASLLNDVWFKKSSRSGKKYLDKNNFAKLKHSLICNNYTPIAWKFFHNTMRQWKRKWRYIWQTKMPEGILTDIGTCRGIKTMANMVGAFSNQWCARKETI